MNPTYEQVYEGEWVQSKRSGYKVSCCDCGLVHLFNYRLVKSANGGKTIQFQVFRNNRATSQIRRHAGLKITRKRKKQK